MGVFAALLRSIGEIALGLIVVGLLAYFPLLGYYGVACRQDGAGWALASLLLLPLAIPPLGLLFVGAGVAVGLVGKPFHAGTGFWSRARWLPVAAVAGGAATWAFAVATSASARCSFGF